MTIWEFGLVTEPFEAVVAGRKTIEGRLNKGKFTEFAPSDIVKIRKDYRDTTGVIHDGEPDAARVKIVGVRKYDDFAAMVHTEGYKKVASQPMSAEQTIASYQSHYTIDEQKRYGVLAIEIEVI